MRIDPATMTAAVDWYVRQRDMDIGAWHAFTDWLEADPMHAAAFDTVAVQDASVDASAPSSSPVSLSAANDDMAVGRPFRWRYALGSVAAALIAIVAIPSLMPTTAEPYTVDTAPGALRSVSLSDGTRIELSGGTRLTLDRKNTRFARLDQGQAVFHVRHDGGAPFTVYAGPFAVQDAGTVFDINRVGRYIDVAVAEGAVLFQPGRGDITVRPGFRLAMREGDAAAEVRKVDIDSIGEWRFGRLSFTNEPLDVAAATLSRMVGADVTLAGELESRRFTGVMKVTGNPARDVPHFAMMTGTNWARHGDKWVVSPPRGSAN